MRALAVDLAQNLQRPVDDLALNWRIGTRTGDTPTAERARQRKRLPTALITTPESLSLLLSYKDTARQLAGVKAVVVDEWHELLGTKRGVQLELALARLRSQAPALRDLGAVGNHWQPGACSGRAPWHCSKSGLPVVRACAQAHPHTSRFADREAVFALVRLYRLDAA